MINIDKNEQTNECAKIGGYGLDFIKWILLNNWWKLIKSIKMSKQMNVWRFGATFLTLQNGYFWIIDEKL